MPSQRCWKKNIITHNVPEKMHKYPPEYDRTKVQYINGQFEKGLNGNFHWQVYVEMKPNQRMIFSDFQHMLFPDYNNHYDDEGQIIGKKCHIERVIQDNGASEYCLKEDTRYTEAETRFEWGSRSEMVKEKRKRHADEELVTIRDKMWKCDTFSEATMVSSKIATRMQWAQTIWNAKPQIPTDVKKTAKIWQKKIMNQFLKDESDRHI